MPKEGRNVQIAGRIARPSPMKVENCSFLAIFVIVSGPERPSTVARRSAEHRQTASGSSR